MKQLFEEKLSLHAVSAILLMFYFGRRAASHGTLGVGTDAWIAMLLGLLMSIPVLLILARLMQLLPEKNLFDMLDYSFGRTIARVICVLYLFYFMALSGSVITKVEFVRMSSLPHTPLLMLLLLFFAAGIYLAKSGILTIGKWSVFAACFVLGISLALTLLAIPSMHVSNLLPIGISNSGALIQGGYQFMLAPLGGAVIVLVFGGKRGKGTSPYRMLFFGAGLAALFFSLTFLRDTAILGVAGIMHLDFAPFHAASAIQVGALGVRVESLVTIIAILSGLTMMALGLFAASSILRSVIGGGEKQRLIPLAIAAWGIALLIGYDFLDRIAIGTIYRIYAPVVQILIPAVLWIGTEIKARQSAIR